MKRILVVGGAGYVGCVLIQELLARGYTVVVADRLYYGADGLHSVRDRIDLIVKDIRALDCSALEDIDAVINVGGLSNDPTAEYNPSANYEMNTCATVALARLAEQAGIQRFVFASSCSIYDRGTKNEYTDLVLDEDADVDPHAPYSLSKYDAECQLLRMAGTSFCPVILRKGTIGGFSPRMRYDLVINSFVKDALSKGSLTLHNGGEMWRPLVDIHDVARSYVAALEAPEHQVRGQIFNVAFGNFRISEAALRVRYALQQCGITADIRPDYKHRLARSYRVCTQKTTRCLGIQPQVGIEESVVDMVRQVREHGYTEFEDPRYYNIRWVELLERAERVIAITGSVFGSNKVEQTTERSLSNR